MPELAAKRRARHRHLQRRHAARRRRQGGRRRDHGGRRAPGRAPGAAAPDAADRLHAGRGDRRGGDAVRHRAVRRPLRLHDRRLRARRAAGRVVLGASRRSSRIDGVDVHPGHATGKLVSALRLAAQIVAELPDRPADARDTTSGREGFIHPYKLTGSPAPAEITADRARLRRGRCSSSTWRCCARRRRRVVEAHPRARLELDVRRQYRNMRDYIERDPEVVEAAGRRSGPRASSRSEARSAAAPTARGCPRWGCRRRTSSTAATSTTRCASGPRVQDMAAAAATIVRLAEVWSPPFAERRRGDCAA